MSVLLHGWHGPGQVLDPSGIALDGQGRIYVADSEITGCKSLKIMVHMLGRLVVPSSPMPGVAVAKDGTVYVSDCSDCIYIFDSSGNLTGSGERRVT